MTKTGCFSPEATDDTQEMERPETPEGSRQTLKTTPNRKNTLSRTTTEWSAHLGASDILIVYPQTHARAQRECKTTTQKARQAVMGDVIRKSLKKATVNPHFEKPHVSC